MSKLNEARATINTIDEQMAKLFEDRMQCVEDVIQYKLEHQLPVLDSTRETQVIEKNMNYIKCEAYKEAYKKFIQETMSISRAYQKSRIHLDHIGYAGTKGAFSHIATKHLFPDHTLSHYPTFLDVVEAVENDEIAYGVLPFENSFTGEVGENLDMLFDHDVYINDIYDLKVSQNLLGIKGSTLQDIKQIYSKDQAISQSRKFLEGRGYDLIPYPNTALAAEYVAKEQNIRKGAIASKETAEIFDLVILAEDINTSSDNMTRFIVISKKQKTEGTHFSMFFTVHHQAGELARVMEVIGKHGFNMESIHSRSLQQRPFEYYFYVEMEGNVNSEATKALLQDMEATCESVKIAGSYKKESRDEK